MIDVRTGFVSGVLSLFVVACSAEGGGTLDTKRPSGQESSTKTPTSGSSNSSSGTDAGTTANPSNPSGGGSSSVTDPTAIPCDKLVGHWQAIIQPGSTADSILGQGQPVEGTMDLDITRAAAADTVSIKQSLNLTKPLPAQMEMPAMEAKCTRGVNVKGVQSSILGEVNFDVNITIDPDTTPPSAEGTFKTTATNGSFTSTGTFKAQKR